MHCAKNTLPRILIGLLGAFLYASTGLADEVAPEPEYTELHYITNQLHIDYRVNEDFSVITTSAVSITPLNENAARRLKTRQFSHSTSIERMEILDAYTKKASGPRLPVSPDSYQISINKGNDGGDPAFSDRTSVTIIFPDVAPHDMIVYRIRETETEPMFPGYFELSQSFYDQLAFEDVQITLDTPEAMKYRLQVRNMTQETTHHDGRTRVHMRYRHDRPIKSERKDFSIWSFEDAPGFAASSFESYEAIAQAYGQRATPKAAPTPRIVELAESIVGTEEDALKKAQLLYEWVAREITYAGNCIGVGAVVPRDTDFVLDHKMGDCKDHATLLQALLKAEGIESTQALINTGSIYHLPEVPMVSSVNHVINYFPQWDRFVDATDDSMPFDTLGFTHADKPVLLVDGYREGMRTTKTRPEQNSAKISTDISVGKNGTAAGTVEVDLKGYSAIHGRASWRHVTPQQEADYLEQQFSTQNAKGFGKLTKDDPTPLRSTYRYSMQFERPEFILAKGAGAFGIYPPSSVETAIHHFLDYDNEDLGDYEIACGNGSVEESYRYHFPAGIRILAIPDNFEIREHHLQYRAHYELNNNILTAQRSFSDSTPGNICSSALLNQQRRVLQQISENMEMQVVYQHHKNP
jgi:transglutaminase-like putative cysteine protease